ncbi:uncharacterized protein MYCGRDRAFT_98058 [Zymoseptoria tritici IPO323]|uniref:Uncharacterized protein n=1 Tax=Zymoseptoria tritici (strain CBS 115943 / IPO323) TaxID=336722 RepID=F9XS68_ZYMTI|nr:uncharacterized protein MYCGRDRAFT_98058 [Zymoseptoria tritici IPO323]EGP81930.1 hypothetical protein MYCGRDRAFT_98058 [Zymoseptoria tritici IPO323]
MSYGEETAVEEVEHDKAAQATNHDDDDDEDSLARLENAASRPISMTQISRPNSTRPELYLAKLKQAKQELYERHEALIESVAARRKRSRAGRRPRGRRCVLLMDVDGYLRVLLCGRCGEREEGFFVSAEAG